MWWTMQATLLFVLLLLLASSHALAPPLRRRQLFLQTTAFVTTTAASSAHAVQERNEALCSTGFFTNIWQARCTELGDITDEGVGRDLSTTEETSVDSLFSKLMESSTSSTAENEEQAANEKETK